MGKDSDRQSCRCGHSPEDQETQDGAIGAGMTRRGFLASLGAGAAVAAAGPALSVEAAPLIMKPEELSRITLRINGWPYPLLVEPRWSLLYVIREKLGFTGTKVGCERGECGACTVIIDDLPHVRLHDAGSRGGRQRYNHSGRPHAWRRAWTDAAGIPGRRRFSMRLLHSRSNHGC